MFLKQNFIKFQSAFICFFYLFQSAYSGSIDKNIAFDAADLTLDYTTDSHTVQLEAFKSSSNDKILSQESTSSYGRLEWFSIGDPKLTAFKNNENNETSLLKFDEHGFSVLVTLLTDKHKELFVNLVKRKYNVDIKLEQIITLIPSNFECQLELHDKNEKLIIFGSVQHFRRFPLEVKFKLPIGAKERDLLESQIKKQDKKVDLKFNCQVSLKGRVTKENVLQVNADQMNQLNVVDDLFGDGKQSVYVTRNQMVDFATHLYSKLSIVEDYQMPQFQFNENFIEDLFKQTADFIEKYVSIDEVLNSISPYNFKDDLKPDVIKEELGRVLSIVKSDSRSLIKVENSHSEQVKDKKGFSLSKSGGVSYKGFGVHSSVSFAVQKENDWSKSNKTAQEQLNELNNYNENDVEWKIEGEKIVPKSIKVSRLVKSKFEKSLRFSRIRRQYFNASYEHSVLLSTLDTHFDYTDWFKNMENKINALNQNIIDFENKNGINKYLIFDLELLYLGYFINKVKDSSTGFPYEDIVVVKNANDRFGSASAIQLSEKDFIRFIIHDILNNEFTISVWVKLDEINRKFESVAIFYILNTREKLMGKITNPKEYEGKFYLKYNETSGPSYEVNYDDSKNRIISAKQLDFNKWYFLAYTHKCDVASIYINGQLEAIGKIPYEQPIYLDYYNGVTNIPDRSEWEWEVEARLMVGAIDQFKIHTNALTKNEIRSLMNLKKSN